MLERNRPRTLSLVAFLLLALPAWRAVAAPDAERGTLALSEVTAGRLLLPSATPGRYRPVPLLGTEVDMHVTGASADVRVVQRFRNPGAEWVEGIYVFPLPGEAAVHRLLMHVGDRVIEGQVKERAEAKKVYTQAKREGRKASLVEQERPNIFTTSVANIGPGDEITVELHYVEALKYDAGRFRLRFPMVVGPRFIPGEPLAESAQPAPAGAGWAFDTDVVPDASRITPPVTNPVGGPINPVTLRVDLAAGFPLAQVQSSYHAMKFTPRADGVLHGELDGPAYADRDFELVWTPQAGHAPRAAAFLEAREGHHYAQIMVMPPAPDTAGLEAPARELILVVDTSGSMEGLSIGQAVAAAHFALTQLRDRDAFNLIQFNSVTESLFSAPRPATPENIAVAARWLDGLRATGGTMMAPALEAALRGEPGAGRVRQVVFLTDGSVGNEEQLFGMIRAQLGHARLFTVGIGTAPNAFFMHRAADFGRGTYTFVGKIGEARERMAELFTRISAPVLTDLEVDWPGAGAVEAWPQRMPDLYLGEPLVVFARLDGVPGQAEIRGRLGSQPWSFRLPLRGAAGGNAVSTLWARHKIKALMNRQLGGQSSAEVRRQVVDLGVDFHLVTRYTSLVAVDVTPVRPAAEALRTGTLPTNLPHGWSYAHVFGGLPTTAAGIAWHLWLAIILLLLGTLAWWWSTAAVPCASPRR